MRDSYQYPYIYIYKYAFGQNVANINNSKPYAKTRPKTHGSHPQKDVGAIARSNTMRTLCEKHSFLWNTFWTDYWYWLDLFFFLYYRARARLVRRRFRELSDKRRVSDWWDRCSKNKFKLLSKDWGEWWSSVGAANDFVRALTLPHKPMYKREER